MLKGYRKLDLEVIRKFIAENEEYREVEVDKIYSDKVQELIANNKDFCVNITSVKKALYFYYTEKGKVVRSCMDVLNILDDLIICFDDYSILKVIDRGLALYWFLLRQRTINGELHVKDYMFISYLLKETIIDAPYYFRLPKTRMDYKTPEGRNHIDLDYLLMHCGLNGYNIEDLYYEYDNEHYSFSNPSLYKYRNITRSLERPKNSRIVLKVRDLIEERSDGVAVTDIMYVPIELEGIIHYKL